MLRFSLCTRFKSLLEHLSSYSRKFPVFVFADLPIFHLNSASEGTNAARLRRTLEKRERKMGAKRARDGESGGEEERIENAYEAERNAMLEENRQRMLELGLLEDAKIFQRAARPYKPKVHHPSDPLRRSSRLQGTTKVCYNEKPQLVTYVPRLTPKAGHSRVHSVPVYSGPVRRSSRLQGTTVSYKAQLDDVPTQWLSDSEDD